MKIYQHRKLGCFFKSTPNIDFINTKLLPAFDIHNINNDTLYLDEKNNIYDKLIPLVDEMSYYDVMIRKIINKNVNPRTVLLHHLQSIGYNLACKEYQEKGKHKRKYFIVNADRPNYEIKNQNILIKFD
jgi:hypothetical protein